MATVDLSKTPRVNLTKNQVINLTKDGSDTADKLTQVFFGAKWGKIPKKRIVRETKTKEGTGFLKRLFGGGEKETIEVEKIVGYESVDLDASLLLFDEDKRLLEKVYYGHKESNDRAISHSGDDLVGTEGGEQESDNETISVNLPKINSRVKYIVAILNSFRHHKFDKIPYIKLRIYSGKVGKPSDILCAYSLANNEDFKGKEAIVLGVFTRVGNGFKFRADGTTTGETSIDSMARGSALNAIR